MHKRISISLDEKIIVKINHYMKGKNLNFSQALENIIIKALK